MFTISRLKIVKRLRLEIDFISGKDVKRIPNFRFSYVAECILLANWCFKKNVKAWGHGTNDQNPLAKNTLSVRKKSCFNEAILFRH